MELTLKNYRKVLSAALLKKAAQYTVRECDEVEKGHFQAYVDEKDSTYDTFLVLNGSAEIIKHGCDCKSVIAFCHHQAALLLFLAKGKKIVTKLGSTKKADPLEILVNEVEPEKLRIWLIDLLLKNKDLGITFMHEFSSKKEQYTPEEVKKLTLDAVKAVAKNKRNLEIGEVKKIVELWTSLHESIISGYCLKMSDEMSFLRLHAIMEALEEVLFKVRTSSSRIDKYREAILLKILPGLNQIEDSAYWKKAVEYFVDRVHGEAFHLRTYYLSFLVGLHQLSSGERKKDLAIDLITQYLKVDPQRFYGGDGYTVVIFNLIVNDGLFEEYYLFFKPIRYANTYNVLLIGLLITHGFIPLAEKYCLEQIAGNSSDEYDRDYFQLLIKIYTINKDDQKLAMVLKETLIHTFDFNAYLFVNQHLECGEEERRKWRTKIFTRARHVASYHAPAMLFSFQLLDHENKYSKMVDYIDSGVTYEVLALYAEKMVLTSRNHALRQIIYRTDNAADSLLEPERLEPFLEELSNTLLKHYSVQELKLVMKEAQKRALYYSPNSLVVFMNRKLSFVKP